jgi:hypothetical protein
MLVAPRCLPARRRLASKRTRRLRSLRSTRQYSRRRVASHPPAARLQATAKALKARSPRGDPGASRGDTRPQSSDDEAIGPFRLNSLWPAVIARWTNHHGRLAPPHDASFPESLRDRDDRLTALAIHFRRLDDKPRGAGLVSTKFWPQPRLNKKAERLAEGAARPNRSMVGNAGLFLR